MNDPDEKRYYPFWALKAMYQMRPPNTTLRVRVRLIDGMTSDGQVTEVGKGELTVRADSGLVMEGVRPEWVEHAEIK